MKLRYSYTNGVSEFPLLGDTIGQNFKRTVEQYPNNLALAFPFQNIELTYQEFWDKTTQLAKSLLATGLANGDRVGIWAPNRYEWTIVQYATARIGLVLVNVNPAYREKELVYVLNQSGCRMLIAANSFKTSFYEELWKSAKSSCPEVKYSCFLDTEWDDLLKKADVVSDEELQKAEELVQFDDPVNIQYTSGTTGFPKGVTLSHHNIQNNGYFIGRRLHYTHEDSVCIPVPFYHCFGMVIGNLACTSCGATMVVPSEAFEPEITLQMVEKYKCTSLYGVPTMFIAELNLPSFAKYDLTSLRTGVMA
ncbi:MAG: AMP-binding protein, partial [Pseudopedobacter saltans]